MRPVVTVAEMGRIDAEAQRHQPVEVLIERAGAAAARSALRLLGGGYGRRVAVVAGKGHNGDDGRVAARRLAERGARVRVVAPDVTPGDWTAATADCDLVVDAAFGTGFRGDFRAPPPPEGVPVLSVDIPSGVNGDTGEACPGAVSADATVTFAALKPGLLLAAGAERAGRVEVADIGLDVTSAGAALVEDADVAAALPRRRRESHKWQTALGVVAGSPGMLGAAELCTRAALRAGAGMIRLGLPGAGDAGLPVGEAVSRGLPAGGWHTDALEWTQRCRAVVIGPGLGRSDETVAAVRRFLAAAPVPVLIDADGLYALGAAADKVLADRPAATVLTPHAGEFSRLAGSPPAADRLESVRELARRTGAVVLLKGSTTVVAAPEGRVLLAASGGPRLATAGTGDVLSGLVGALLAQGVEPLLAAALGAHVHGRAAAAGPGRGLVAGDVAELLPAALTSLAGPVDA